VKFFKRGAKGRVTIGSDEPITSGSGRIHVPGARADIVAVEPGGIVFVVEAKGRDSKLTQEYVERLKAIGADPIAVEFAQQLVREQDDSASPQAGVAT